MSERYITKILIDLSAWSDHYPTGCILYHYGQVVDSAYCDNTEEFEEYLETNKKLFIKHVTDIVVMFDQYDIDDKLMFKCAREVCEFARKLINN